MRRRRVRYHFKRFHEKKKCAELGVTRTFEIRLTRAHNLPPSGKGTGSGPRFYALVVSHIVASSIEATHVCGLVRLRTLISVPAVNQLISTFTVTFWVAPLCALSFFFLRFCKV